MAARRLTNIGLNKLRDCLLKVFSIHAYIRESVRENQIESEIKRLLRNFLGCHVCVERLFRLWRVQSTAHPPLFTHQHREQPSFLPTSVSWLLTVLFCSQILSPWLGDIVDNPMPQSTISPSQGLTIGPLVSLVVPETTSILTGLSILLYETGEFIGFRVLF